MEFCYTSDWKFIIGKYLANDGADKFGQYWIKLEKTMDNVSASLLNWFVVIIELSSLTAGLLSLRPFKSGASKANNLHPFLHTPQKGN